MTQAPDEQDVTIARALTWRYAIALVLVATLCTAAWLSLHWVINEQKSTAAVVNVSGRQRMLSQRTALFAQLLVNAPVAKRPEWRQKLTQVIDLMALSHRGLTHGDASLGLPVPVSPAVRAMYFDTPVNLDEQVNAYLDAARRLLHEPDARLMPSNPYVLELTQSAQHSLLAALDDMVALYQREGEAKVAQLETAETVFWVLTLLLLGLEAALIFRPFARHVQHIIGKLQATTAELTVHRTNLEGLVNQRTQELQQQTQALKASQDQLRIAAIAFNAQMGMTVCDAHNTILQVNQAFTDITGYTAEEVVGKTPHVLSSGRHSDAFYQAMFASIAKDGMWAGEIWNRHKNGGVFPEWLTITAVKDDAGCITHYVAAFSDISERKAAESQIRNLAFYDPLTNLPNRRLLLDRLELAMAASSRTEAFNALLFIDLDNFKNINDTLGHHVGDQLLRQAAQRISEQVRMEDTVARFGGDEFVVMLEDLADSTDQAVVFAENIGLKILHTLHQPYSLGELICTSSASIGVALFSGLRESIDDLLKRADISMYQAKASGRNALRFFDPEIENILQAKALLETELREALAQQQFCLYYQPQVLADGTVAGAEALVRWRHPQRGMVSPAEFIPVAEQLGLIVQLGQWVLETACEQLARWQTQKDMANCMLSVNVSVVQFRRADFVDRVISALTRTGAQPSRLKLELTESLLVDDVDDVIEKMTTLKTLGVTFSLDDFGTGYSSLAYLSRLPLDQLKIDQGFVRDIETSENAVAICAATISLAHSLRLKVVAEGVETQAQLYFLTTVHHCDLIQGYLFSRPLPLEEFEALSFEVKHRSG